MSVLIALTFVLAQTASTPTTAQEWFDRGVQMFDAGNFTVAIEAFTKARDAGYGAPPQVNLRIARAQVRAGDLEGAFKTLTALTGTGFGQVETLLAENDFFPLRTDKRWTGIVDTTRANQRPCEKDPVYRQFDYWLGEWDVEVGGKRVARSSIQLILSDCVISENYWRLDNTYSGKSYSMWDAANKRWEQNYVDSGGSSSHWLGALENDRIVFYDRTGKVVQRMTYTKEGPDHVRQTIDVSSDEEKTWNSGFNGLYVRRK